MREFVDFRVREADAETYLPPGTGERLSSGVRKVVVNTSDPLFNEIGRLHKMFLSQGRVFFTGREYRRKYSRQELREAQLLHVWPQKLFEPAGEECSTVYDDTTGSQHVFSFTPETEMSGYRVPGSV